MSADENGPLPDLSALASSGIAKVTIAGQDFIPASHLAEALTDVKRLRALLGEVAARCWCEDATREPLRVTPTSLAQISTWCGTCLACRIHAAASAR